MCVCVDKGGRSVEQTKFDGAVAAFAPLQDAGGVEGEPQSRQAEAPNGGGTQGTQGAKATSTIPRSWRPTGSPAKHRAGAARVLGRPGARMARDIGAVACRARATTPGPDVLRYASRAGAREVALSTGRLLWAMPEMQSVPGEFAAALTAFLPKGEEDEDTSKVVRGAAKA